MVGTSVQHNLGRDESCCFCTSSLKDGDPWGPPYTLISEKSLFGMQGVASSFRAPTSHSLHEDDRPVLLAVCCSLGMAPGSLFAPVHPPVGQSAVRSDSLCSARQECLWAGASSMCATFPLTQGAKVPGAGPRPRRSHGARPSRVSAGRDPGVGAPSCSDGGSAFP